VRKTLHNLLIINNLHEYHLKKYDLFSSLVRIVVKWHTIHMYNLSKLRVQQLTYSRDNKIVMVIYVSTNGPPINSLTLMYESFEV